MGQVHGVVHGPQSMFCIRPFFFRYQNDIFNNPKTKDIKFLISRNFEVTILLRKSEEIKGLPNR